MRAGGAAMKHALAVAVCAISLIFSGAPSARAGAQHNVAEETGRKPGGNSIYLLNSTWTDQDGRTARLARFQGKPLVLAMIYTRCKDACPMLVLDMQKIENALPEAARASVQFVLLSFDPDQDSPAQLKRYASDHGLDTRHWTLLTGSADAVRMLAAVLGVRYQKQPTGDFSHSSVITVLNSAGEICHQEVGLGHRPAEIVAVINGLMSSAR